MIAASGLVRDAPAGTTLSDQPSRSLPAPIVRCSDLLRHPTGAQRRAVRQARRVLQGEPERRGDHRPAHRARSSAGERCWAVQGAAGDARPAAAAGSGHISTHRSVRIAGPSAAPSTRTRLPRLQARSEEPSLPLDSAPPSPTEERAPRLIHNQEPELGKLGKAARKSPHFAKFSPPIQRAGLVCSDSSRAARWVAATPGRSALRLNRLGRSVLASPSPPRQSRRRRSPRGARRSGRDRTVRVQGRR
jgi:hypothetical protein